MTIRTSLLLAAVLTVAVTSPMRAEMVIGQDGQVVLGPDGNPLQRSVLEAACSTSIERFCPELSDPPGQTRNQVMCLRPYRTSLPPSCRRAVDAARK